MGKKLEPLVGHNARPAFYLQSYKPSISGHSYAPANARKH